MNPSLPALELPFLRRLVLTGLALTLLTGVAAAAVSRLWALHFVVIGLWMVINAVFLGVLLWAGTSTPRRPFALMALMPLKVGWLALLPIYVIQAEPPNSALAAGLTMFFVAVVGSVLHWMCVHKPS